MRAAPISSNSLEAAQILRRGAVAVALEGFLECGGGDVLFERDGSHGVMVFDAETGAVDSLLFLTAARLALLYSQ